MKRYAVWLVLTAFVLLMALKAWLEFGPGRNVYEVDLSFDSRPTDCAAETDATAVRLAVLGDFGESGKSEADVADLVHSWGVDYIVTVGDNNYHSGRASTIDKNIGRYYHAYIQAYSGKYGIGSIKNRFFPALGNHDWQTGSIQAHLDYFALPGNERYYEVQLGPIHLFVLDSDRHEPDGYVADSIQAQWLQTQMSTSTAPWKLVSFHHAPYSSGGQHGNNVDLQWPFTTWGATAILAGHEHIYERQHINDILYFVNGLGGRRRIHPLSTPNPGSAVRYNGDYGAMLINATVSCINFSFYNRSEALIDSHTVWHEN